MAKHNPVKYKISVDLQCGACGALTHQKPEELFPKFCAGCGAGMEKFCLKCHKKIAMYFEEWWPQDDECVRTYCTPKRCTQCNAVLENGPMDGLNAGHEYDH